MPKLVLSWERVNAWTNTLYALLHSLEIARRISFGNLSTLNESVKSAKAWINPECSFASILLDSPTENKKLIFRRDPNAHFSQIAENVVKMLLQDLTVILDEMSSEILRMKGEAAGDFAQSKIAKLSQNLDAKYKWASQGCLELVAVRNVLCHNNGHWNQRALDIIKPFCTSLPTVGSKLVVGVPMLFYYRKALRTFLNEVARIQ